MSSFLRVSFYLGLLLALAGAVDAAADSSAPGMSPNSMVEPDGADVSRAIPLEGAMNVRDLGGLKGIRGAIPYGHFIRAANLARLTSADRDKLYKQGVILDIDLRTTDEEHGNPDVLENDPHIRYLPISLFGPALTRPASLREMYVDALANDQSEFKQVFNAIAAAGQGGVLYHCTVGKDRTGIISAMLLQLAGVPRDRIEHNYELSAYYLRQMTSPAAMDEMRKKQPALAALMDSPPEAIDGFLDALNNRYGGTAAYLQTIGLSSSDIEKIRGRLSP